MRVAVATPLTVEQCPDLPPSYATRAMFRGKLSGLLILKVFVTASVIGLLLWRIDLHRFADALRASLGPWLVFAFVSNSLALVISSYKWARLLEAVGIHESRWRLLELYTIGSFMNAFLPGVVAGDVVRWQIITCDTGQRLKVAATILVERLSGVLTLVVLAAVLVLTVVPKFGTPPVLMLLVGATLVVGLGVVLVASRRLAVSALWRVRRSPLQRVLRPIHRLQRTLRLLPRSALLVAVGCSVLFYLSAGFTYFLICRSFGADVTMTEATTAQALICLLMLAPISLGGLGLAQAGDVYLLGVLGVGAATALGVSVARLLSGYMYAGVGALLFLRWKPRSSARTSDSHRDLLRDGEATRVAMTGAPRLL
jgi:hypothetical protein